ncbi:unnamed protein product [Linum trigynum]|uniref:Uncharacterized protein n=1 Tax=Linum trigynum TaxID=586398 RepID=A0AAV2DBP8_9ROSI
MIETTVAARRSLVTSPLRGHCHRQSGRERGSHQPERRDVEEISSTNPPRADRPSAPCHTTKGIPNNSMEWLTKEEKGRRSSVFELFRIASDAKGCNSEPPRSAR